MNKNILLILATILLMGCGNKQPSEISISKNDVDITGNAFQSFKLGGEVRLLMAANPQDNSKWMIRATAPVQKIDALPIDELTAEINLLDANGTKVREGFSLIAEDLESVIPVFNAGPNTEKTIVFSAGEGMRRDFSFKEASELLNQVKKIGLIINKSNGFAKDNHNTSPSNTVVSFSMETKATQIATEPTAANPSHSTTVTVTTDPVQENSSKALTLNDLLKKHGIYGMLAQYEKHWKKGERRKAKEVEDRLWEIEKRVQHDTSIPKSLRDRFVKYIEDKEDEIERKH